MSPFNSLVHLMILCSASLATYMYSMYPRGTPQRHEAQAHHVGMRMIFYPGADERTRPLPVYPNGPPKSPGRPGDGAISSFHFPHRFHCWRPLKQRAHEAIGEIWGVFGLRCEQNRRQHGNRKAFCSEAYSLSTRPAPVCCCCCLSDRFWNQATCPQYQIFQDEFGVLARGDLQGSYEDPREIESVCVCG